ncbi:Transcription elongation factor SPT5 [Balamuthia mandrillaris]
MNGGRGRRGGGGGGGGRGRGGGGGYALTLDTGNRLHITMVYFRSLVVNGETAAPSASLVERKEKIRAMAEEFCKERFGGKSAAPLEVGEMWGQNSIHVVGELATVKTELVTYFMEKGYNVDTGRQGVTAHINLKGHPKTTLNPSVDFLSGWIWM